MTPVLTKNDKDYSISLIRLTAMLFIFLCHLLQKYNNVLGGWFDCGVQMFFFISGFLYSTKIIDNILSFYQKQFIKILSDYYIFIIIFFALCFLSQHSFNITEFSNSLILFPHINGTEHLWFIRYILTCYLLLPIFIFILDKLKDANNKFYLPIIFLFAVLIEGIFSFIFHIKGAWLVCFLLGMVYKRLKHTSDNKNLIAFSFLTIFFAIIFVAFRILCYYRYIKLNSFYYNYIWQYCHIFLGVSIAVVIYYICLKYFSTVINKAKKILDISDTYSYDFYIVHYSIIQNIYLFSFLNQQNIYITGVLCFLLSFLFAFCLKHISQILKKIISNTILSLKGGNIC